MYVDILKGWYLKDIWNYDFLFIIKNHNQIKSSQKKIIKSKNVIIIYFYYYIFSHKVINYKTHNILPLQYFAHGNLVMMKLWILGKFYMKI